MNEDASASASASAQNGEDHATGATDDAVSSTTGSPSNRINIVAHEQEERRQEEEEVAQLNEHGHQHQGTDVDNEDLLSSSDDEVRDDNGRTVSKHRLNQYLSTLGHQPSDEGVEDQEKMDWNDPNQVQKLTERNAELMRRIKEKDKELARMEEAIIAIEPLPGLEADKFLEGQNSADHDPRDTKIRDLAKKARNMRLQVQRERDKSSRLEAEVSRWKQQARQLENQEQKQRHNEADESGVDEENKELRSQVKNLTQRLEKSSVKTDKLQHELRLTQRALQKEVGEGIPLENVIQSVRDEENYDRVHGQGVGHSGAWKGRAQKIVILKNKVKRLEEQLHKAGIEGYTDESKSTHDEVGDRAEQQLASLHEQRRRHMEELRSQCDDAIARESQCKDKLQRANARLQVLESNYNQQKQRMQTMLHKTENDNKLIDALREKIQMLKSEREDSKEMVRVAYAGGSRDTNDSKVVSSLKEEIAQLRRENEQLKGANGNGGNKNISRPGSSDSRKLAQLESEAAEKEQKYKVIQEQNYKLQEYVRLIEARASQSDELAKQYMNRSANLEKRCRELEKRRGDHYTPEKEDSLMAELKTVKNENTALKQHHEAALASRDEEIQYLRASLEAIEDKIRKSNTPGGNDDGETIEQLRQDNEILRKEVAQLKQRLRKIK